MSLAVRKHFMSQRLQTCRQTNGRHNIVQSPSAGNVIVNIVCHNERNVELSGCLLPAMQIGSIIWPAVKFSKCVTPITKAIFQRFQMRYRNIRCHAGEISSFKPQPRLLAQRHAAKQSLSVFQNIGHLQSALAFWGSPPSHGHQA